MQKPLLLFSCYFFLLKVYLQILRRRPRADGERDLVVELVDDEVEIDGLLPVDVGVADGQLAAVAAENLHQEAGQVGERAANGDGKVLEKLILKRVLLFDFREKVKSLLKRNIMSYFCFQS